MASTKRWLGAVLFLSFVVGVVGISAPDMYTDEVLYAFRAIENVDYDESADQTTPLEWFDETRTQQPGSIPSWTKFSFHDHPPLFFWTLHVSQRIFGETPFAARLPSALFGVLAVFAVYLIGKELFGEREGLFAALLLAVTTNHLYISRIGLQESMLIALGLMGVLFVLRAANKPKKYIWAGLWFGLAFLTKYNAVLFVALGALAFIVRRRNSIPWKQLAIGLIVFLLVISPVLAYNIMLYRAVGHFDFQFSYVFGQNPDVWSVTPGKEIGSIGYRANNFVLNMIGTHSPLFLSISILGLLWVLFRKRTSSYLLLLGMIGIVVAYVIFVVGVSYRFLTMLTPLLALLAGAFLASRTRVLPKSMRITAIVGIVIIELLYGMNSTALARPIGSPILAYAEKSHSELQQTGYRALGDVLARELEGSRPEQVFSMQYQFLDELHEATIAKQRKQDLPTKSMIIIYDPDVHNLAQLWYFDRLNIFHAWPALNIDQYAEYASLNGLSFPEANFKNHLVIIRAQGALSRREESLNQSGEQMEQLLLSRGLEPEIVRAPSGEEAFRLYRF